MIASSVKLMFEAETLGCHNLVSEKKGFAAFSFNCCFVPCPQILGVQEDSATRPETYSWAGRWVQKRHIELDRFLLLCEGITHEPHGRAVQEAGDSWQTQGRGLLLCQSSWVLAPTRWAISFMIPSDIHTFFPEPWPGLDYISWVGIIGDLAAIALMGTGTWEG